MTDTDTLNPEQQSSSRRLWRRLVWGCVLVVTLVVGFVGYQCYRGLRFVDRVEAAGGSVLSDSEPGWMEEWLGDRYSLALKSHDMITLASQGRFELLSQYPDQFGRVLVFSSGTINREQADAFAALELNAPDSMVMIMGSAPIHAKFYDALSTHRELVYVGFTGAPVNVTAFADMGPMPKLQSVSMEFCKLEDSEGAAIPVSHFPQLYNLSFRHTDLDDESFGRFEELINQCTHLELGETKITDRSIQKMKPTAAVQALLLVETEITDESLKHLALFKDLEFLYVTGTQVTEQGVEEFQKQNSRCKVFFQEP